MKTYPHNGPTMAEQAKVVYHWNNPQAAKEAYRNFKQNKKPAESAK